MRNPPPEIAKTLTLTCFLASLALTANPAQAINYNFTFSNVTGPVAGTVAGTITLPDGDGTFAATGITVTSAPAALGYTYPFDVLANLTTVGQNTFTVTGGAIDPVASSFYAYFTPDNIVVSAFGLSATLPNAFFPGSSFTIQQSTDVTNGVVDVNNSTLAFSATPVPLETDSLPVIGSTVLFGLGLWGKRKLAQKQINQEETNEYT
ncbi:MAG: hypothetical protein RLZZ490_709 [Cyanobacteriota bacterium]|jgi:hypothetical protein